MNPQTPAAHIPLPSRLRPVLALLLGAAVLLSGCVTAGRPAAADAGTAKPAILRGHVDVFRYYTQGESKVTITAIDNRATAPLAASVPIAPGRRLVTVNILALPLGSRTATVAWEFQSGRQYRVTARRAGHAFDLLLWDESEGADNLRLLATSRVGEEYANLAGADSATLHGTTTDALGHGPRGEPFVRITAVNGQTVAAGWGRPPDVHVAPGRNLVTVDLRTRSDWHAAGTVELEFEPRKTYCLSALQTDSRFDLLCWVVLPALDTRALVATRPLQGKLEMEFFPLGGLIK